MAKKLTYTYKDNPYPEGTTEHHIWYTAFVHGLNSATRGFAASLDSVYCILKEISKTSIAK